MSAQAPPKDLKDAAERVRTKARKLRDAGREAQIAAAQLEDMLVGKGILLEIKDDNTTTARGAGEGE
jgi:hypothetical protein